MYGSSQLASSPPPTHSRGVNVCPPPAPPPSHSIPADKELANLWLEALSIGRHQGCGQMRLLIEQVDPGFGWEGMADGAPAASGARHLLAVPPRA